MASTESKDPSPSTTSTPPTRRAYKGSCHSTDTTTTRFRKCNCSTCHKTAFFHVRLPHEPEDFLLLAPRNPFADLADYTCFESRIHWFFCGTCGVRCFAFAGEGEEREVDVEGEKRMVWSAKREGWVKGTSAKGFDYLTVNGMTIEPGQEGFDMREWVEKGWIAYLDVKDRVGEPRFRRPYDGGVY
ncbi:hypothetical protein LSUB1_G007064 [Lachnellula subtilissima]|uniref:CENP-V/GFA domain-containing protein n=1 Tax=Lachnellula subtilissima TaxID=602034 RepID=A0A8H8UA71_9HELO|nr:hypothetical protein LSUB1_G007064 [Lachnellula subtilissima]